jgi:hypothetical protein
VGAIRIYIFLACLLALWGCKEKIDSPSGLMKWIDDPGHGYTIRKTIGGVDLKVKYMPKELLALNEMEYPDIDKRAMDSLVQVFGDSRTFLFTVGPNETGGKVDIMLAGIASQEEFNARAMEVNFGMDKYLSLQTGKNTYRPILVNLENVYGLSNHRNFYVVFAPHNDVDDLFSSEELTITFSDQIFNTGINQFTFKKEDIDFLPQMTFLE